MSTSDSMCAEAHEIMVKYVHIQGSQRPNGHPCDAGKLKEVLEADEGFRHMGRAEVNVLNACVGAKLTMEKGEEAIDVCQAIQEMNQKAAENAAEKERISTLLKSIGNLMEKAGWSAEHSMDVLDVSEGDRRELQQLIR